MISAVALADPLVTVIVSVPFATEVTSPADDTVAMVVSEDDHVTVAPEITVPPASFTVAVSDIVSPRVTNVCVVGDTSTVETT